VKSFDHLNVDGCVVKLARWHVKDIHKVVQNAMARHNKHAFTPPFPHLYHLLVKTCFQTQYYCVDCGLWVVIKGKCCALATPNHGNLSNSLVHNKVLQNFELVGIQVWMSSHL
jgi:hypothetical protein